MNKKYRKDEELKSIFNEFKKLKKINSVNLRKQLELSYPEIWSNTNNDPRSDEKRIRRTLDILVSFGLAKKEKIGKEYIYIYNDNKKIDNCIDEFDIKSPDSFYKKRESILSELNKSTDIYFFKNSIEDISNKEKIIKSLEVAIFNKNYTKIVYNGKKYTICPLKIAMFDGFWYLIAKYKSKYITKYRIKNITYCFIIKDKHYPHNEDINIENWKSIYHDPNSNFTTVKIFIDKSVVSYFKDKNILKINDNLSRVFPCQDGIEYEVDITHYWKLLPTLMQWQFYVTIIEQKGDIDIINIYKKALDDIKKRLDF